MPSSRIEDFYNSESFALVGMSKKKRNFAWEIYRNFRGADKIVFPIHRDGGEKDGVAFFRNINEIDGKPDSCIVCTNLKDDDSVISELAESGVRNFWFQQGSYNKDVLKKTRESGIDPITGCALMYLPGTTFIHRFHKFFHELLSKGQV